MATLKKIIPAATILMGALIAHSAVAAIKPFSANYQFNIEGKYNGSAVRTLTQVGNQYKYDVNAKVGRLASATQSTVFNSQSGVVMPLTSTTQYKILGTGRTTTLSYNYSKKQLTTSYKGQTKVIAMPRVAFDDLSLEIQVREDLKNGKFQGNYVMADRNSIDTVPFTKSGTTKITVPAGTFDVIRIDRVHDDKSRQTSFWLAPALDYLPIKVVQNDDGKKMEMNLSSINR